MTFDVIFDMIVQFGGSGASYCVKIGSATLFCSATSSTIYIQERQLFEQNLLDNGAT